MLKDVQINNQVFELAVSRANVAFITSSLRYTSNEEGCECQIQVRVLSTLTKPNLAHNKELYVNVFLQPQHTWANVTRSWFMLLQWEWPRTIGATCGGPHSVAAVTWHSSET